MTPEEEESEEEHAHGAGEVVEYDEHVWTSPRNAAAIVYGVAESVRLLDPDNSEMYKSNSDNYAAEIMELDQEFADFFDTVENKTLVFGDRFPLRYFADEFGLDCYAAFPGCSTQTEPSAATIAFLTQKVRDEHLTCVYYIEFSNHLVADSIAEAARVQTAQFHSCHNVSQLEMDGGATYVLLMRGNLEILKETMR
jgi:zinc transport system substrate-binding protein